MNDLPHREQSVFARDVLAAIRECQRLGHRRVLESLEQREPDLAEHLMEELGQLHRQLLNTGLDARKTRTLYRSIEDLALVCIRATEISHSGSSHNSK